MMVPLYYLLAQKIKKSDLNKKNLIFIFLKSCSFNPADRKWTWFYAADSDDSVGAFIACCSVNVSIKDVPVILHHSESD